MPAIDTAWIIGWAIGAAVVVVAAVLLLAIIVLARRIAAQADDITRALDGSRENTTAMFELPRTALAIDRITRGLAKLRSGDGR